MAAEFIIAPEAAQDIDEAYGWYERQRAGLGEEFLSCVDACFQAIGRTPEIYPIVHEDYRRGLLRRFPYAVFYEFARDTVTIYCVRHDLLRLPHVAGSSKVAPAPAVECHAEDENRCNTEG